MQNNKWVHGDVQFELPNLHPRIISSPGLKPTPLILDQDTGLEIVLLAIEPGQALHKFHNRKSLRFEIKSGLVNTSHGPVMFLLYIIPDPVDGNDVVYENSIDPTNCDILETYRKLSNQQYWHLIFIDQQAKVHNFFEFENLYELGETLNQVEDVVKDMDSSDFLAAKAEYENRYTVEYLLSLA